MISSGLEGFGWRFGEGLQLFWSGASSAARPARWGCSVSCRGPCFKATLVREWAKVSKDPGVSGSRLVKTLLHFPLQTYLVTRIATSIDNLLQKKKQLNENQAQLNVLIIDLCICMFQSTDLYL